MKTEDEFKAEVQALLDQFGQAILYGPPGTGKTRLARGVAAKILRLASVDELEGEKERFQFVQFHPSYNYEDFVRGIRMETDDNGQVAYKIENRVFGEIAERALANKGEPHVLVIDEINRANVSAVLGELIYGLEMEYRGNKVQTPYEVDGGYGLTVPSNLKVIGTMNTADRTIGQIDYAVRRRFAFVPCPPRLDVLDEKARGFFEEVDKLFTPEFLSPGHDREDVRVGHSYFLVDKSKPDPELQFANKIIYQVVPILREYLKDGVLKADAKDAIDDLESGAFAVESAQGRWHWIRKTGEQSAPLPLGQMVLSLVSHYANAQNVRNIEDLHKAFPKDIQHGYGVVQDFSGAKVQSYKDPAKRYFTGEGDRIVLRDGSVAVVTSQWGDGGKYIKHLGSFEICAERHGYIICAPYRLVNVGEGRRRDWDDCRKFGFLGAGGLNSQGVPQYADELKTLRKGDRVFASISRTGSAHKGFVGYGRIVKEAVPIRKFRVASGSAVGNLLLECGLKAPDAGIDKDKDNECEWVVGVKWIKTFDREQAVAGRGNPHIVWQSRDIAMLRDLKVGFGIKNTDE